MVAVRHVLAMTLIVLGFGGAVAVQAVSVVSASAPHVDLMEMDDTIQPISARYLARGIDAATESGAHLLVVQLNTPGGRFSSTRDMVARILASDVPVVVYVSPSGAQAASAGTFIAASAHVAAMAPGTNIGAASPVAAGGEDLPKTLEAKAKQDAAALMRSIAEERGRNIQALQDTVFDAVSYAASEAVANNIVDLVARDLTDLLTQLDGRQVQLHSGGTVLQTEGLEIRPIERTALERFLGFLANPDIAFLLVSLGSLGIFIELLAPGLVAPGIVGGILLALGFVALGNLPVNWVGVALLLFSMVLFFAEMQAPGVGLFGVAGAVSFVLGAFFLFGEFSPPPIETPSFQVNIWLIAGTAAGLVGVLVFLVRDLAAARKAASAGQSQASAVGQIGQTTTVLSPHGTVQVAGELWSAVSDSGQEIREGEEVMVLEEEGLTLKVFQADDQDEPTLRPDTPLDQPS